MTIHFGNDFDNAPLQTGDISGLGYMYAGPEKLLTWLESQLGLSGNPNNIDYLRVELYRQSIAQIENAFYRNSYQADRFATAAYLLSWRDELLLGGWDFETTKDCPIRLTTLAQIETIFRKKIHAPENLTLGFADRFQRVLEKLGTSDILLEKVILYEPENYQEPVIMRFLSSIRLEIGQLAIEEVGSSQQTQSLPETIVLRSRRDSDAATFLAQLIRENPELYPTFIVPQPSLALELNLFNEGFPAMGVLSGSLARPSLQILKLAPVFLWEPVDVYKVMEFLTLPLKPLDSGLAQEIARVMADKPGFFSDTWFAAVFGYQESLEDSSKTKEQYDFWFDRRRYPMDQTAPKKEASQIYAYLMHWAKEHFEASGSNNNSLLVLAEQARRIHDLLEKLPEQRISYLELERIVRTIFEGSPVQLSAPEKGRFNFVHKPGSLTNAVENLIWWDFVADAESPKPEKWTGDEKKYLEEHDVMLSTPTQKSRLKQLLRRRPLEMAQKRLILVVPDQVDGAEVSPALLLSDIQIALGDSFFDQVFHVDKHSDRVRLSKSMKGSDHAPVALMSNQRQRPFLQIANPDLIPKTEYETATNLENLLYYPYRWFFRQKLRLYPSSLLSVKSDFTLLGSLAHRFFENLLKENLEQLDRDKVQSWVEEQAKSLLPREGATLLLYGREPEKNAFLNKVTSAAWSLVSIIRANNWKVKATELDLEGRFNSVPLRGKADIVLERETENAIVDLKWGGFKRRKELIMNEEDLQLVLYASLLKQTDDWPHTAYFILEEGKMISRNTQAFKEAILAGRDDIDHIEANSSILNKMEKTCQWRLAQIQRGSIELRTARTAVELDSIYEAELLELLEMKSEDARWDDYRMLLF